MSKRTSPFIVFKYRDFAIFASGTLASRIGDEMQNVVLLWQVYTLTNSPLALGIIGLARFIPVMLVSLFAGVTADRFDRKKILLGVNILFMIVSICLTIATFTGVITAFYIYLAIVIQSIGRAFDISARQSIVPQLVPENRLKQALSINVTFFHVAIVLGPAVAGFLIEPLGVGTIHLINTLSFLAIIASVFLIKPIKQAIHHTTTYNFKSLFEGLSFIFSKKIFFTTILMDFFATFFASSTTLMPIFAKEIFKVGPQGLGVMYAAPSIGGVIAGVAFASKEHHSNQGKILLACIVVYGLAIVMFGLTGSFWLALLFLFITGFTDVISAVIRQTLRQLITPDHLRGRMTAANMLFAYGGPQLGEVEAGLTATWLGARNSVVFGGIGTLVTAFILIYIAPEVLKYQGTEYLKLKKN